ncbi:GNAT family N-acetyltransferase [Streptomyces sp. NPDC059631]|uniref:GNAT family N-acetyltransferase n=1 Tax=unclassified Streptomyces TaxID=2593676 RepID=UPI0036A5830A
MPSSAPIPLPLVVGKCPHDALDELAPLRYELLHHHAACAPHLGEVRSAAEPWQIRRAQYQDRLEEPDATVLTVREDGRLLGYAFARIVAAAGSWTFGDRVGVLETLVVAAEARGRGLGRRLLQAVDEHCRARGATSLRISVIDGATDKSGRDYGGLTGGARAAQCVRDTLARMAPGTTPGEAVEQITAALAELREQWNVPAGDPVAPSAVAAVVVPALGLVWRVGDVHVALRRGATWTRLPATKRIDDVLAGSRAAYTHCMLADGRSEEEIAEHDPGRAVILPILKEQGRLANRPGPYGYGVFDGTPVPADFVEIIPFDGDVEEVVLATDGFLSPAATLAAAEAELREAISQDPLRVGVNPGTKGIRPGADSFDDRTYARMRLAPDPTRTRPTPAAEPGLGGGLLERLHTRAERAFS